MWCGVSDVYEVQSGNNNRVGHLVKVNGMLR